VASVTTADVLAAGVDAAAVIGAISGAVDAEAATRALLQAARRA
jgi:thiamine monophosphate synthase